MFYYYEMEYEAAQYLFLLIPFSALPFTYITSFIFTVDSAAQTFSMFLHFFSICVMGVVIIALRFSPDLESLGDFLNVAFKLIPTYILASSTYCETTLEFLI